MKLTKVEIKGYKRFLNATARIDNKLIAIVGPNEAGKTSFLKALISLEHNEPYESFHLTKKLELKEDAVIIRAIYYIEDSEREKLQEFNGIGHPRFYTLYKLKNGERFHSLIETQESDKIKRNKSQRENTIRLITKIIENKRLKNFLLDKIYINKDEERGEETEVSFMSMLNNLKMNLNTKYENLPNAAYTIAGQLETITEEWNVDKSSYGISKLKSLLDDFNLTKSIEKEDHPKDKFSKHLDSNRPKFIFFSNEDRILQSSYNLENLENPTSALTNLIRIGDCNVEEILNSINESNDGVRLELNQNLNLKLKSIYSESWSQDNVYPQVIIDKDGIRIQINSVLGYNEITDRSEGWTSSP